jgi:hypothetical protein
VFTGTCEAFAMRTPPVICSSMYLTYGLRPVRYTPLAAPPEIDHPHGRSPAGCPFSAIAGRRRGEHKTNLLCPAPALPSASCGIPRGIRAIRCASVWVSTWQETAPRARVGRSTPLCDSSGTYTRAVWPEPSPAVLRLISSQASPRSPGSRA